MVATRLSLASPAASLVNASRCWGTRCGGDLRHLIPSALVHYGLLPDVVIESTTKFYKSTNILYLYICCIIVGSIMSMNRTTLIQGFLKIFFPMLCGEVVGMLVGIGVGTLLGMEPFRVLLYRAADYGRWRGRGGDPAVNGLCRADAWSRAWPGPGIADGDAWQPDGDRHLRLPQPARQALPHLTGEGQLMPNRSHETRSLSESEGVSGKTDVGTLPPARCWRYCCI